MATSNRDVKLTLGVQTTGAEDIDKLKKSVEQLAKEGGDAAPEFQQLADEIDRLGQQAAALNTFQQLADATAELTRSQATAEASTAELAAQLRTLGDATERAKNEQQQAAAVAKTAGQSYTDLKNELQILRNTYDENGDRAANYKAEVERLTRAKIEAKSAFDAARESLRQNNTAVREAEQAEAKLQTTYSRSDAALQGVNSALRERSAALSDARTAAEQLGVSTDNVVSSQVQLTNALNRVGNEAATVRSQMQFLAQSQDEYAASQQRAKQAADAAAKAATDAAAQMQRAFGTVGLRSAQELEAEIRDVREAMDLVRSSAGLTGAALSTAMASGNARIQELERNLREVRGELTLADKAAGLFKNSMGQIAAGNIIADGVGYLVNKIKEMGREFVVAITQLETFRRALGAIYKDTNTTASQLDFLRQSAQDAGVSVGSISDSFVKFSAAMKFANVPLAESNALFEAVTRAAGTLGLSGERTTLMLDALAQMASKGTVSMEELRQQLGDSLPGALSLTAKGLGITDAQLIKLVESGNLATRDFIPAFTKALGELRGETEGIVPTWERFKNALTLTSQTAGDAGGIQLLTLAIKTLAAITAAVVIPLNSFFQVIGAGAQTVGVLVGAIATLTNPMEELERIWGAAGARIDAVNTSFGNVIVGADASSAAISANTQTVVANITATDGLTRSQQASAIAAALAKDGATNLGGQYVLLTTQIANLLSSQEKETESLAKIAKATKEQGDTLVALAKLRGDEQGILQASVVAADSYAAAQARVAASQLEELNLLTLQRDALVENRTKRGDTAEAIATETKALDEKIVKGKAEVEQTNAAAAAATQEAEARRLAAQMYRDNSAAIAQYTTLVSALTEKVKELEALERAGFDVTKGLASARKSLAEATALQRDAVKDLVTNLKLEAQEKTIALQATLQSKNAEAELYQAKAQSAKASGDLQMATYYETQAKRAKIEADKISIEIKKIELELERAELKLKLESLNTDDALYAQKKREIELRLQMTDIRGKELTAARELIRIRESELSNSIAMGGAISRETSLRGANTQAIDAETAARMRALDVKEREISLTERDLNLKQKERELETRKRMDNVMAPIDNVPTFSSMEEAEVWLEEFKKAYRESNSTSSTSGPWGSYLYELAMAEFEAEVKNLEQKAEVERRKRQNQQQNPTGGGGTPTGGGSGGGSGTGRPSGGSGLGGGGGLATGNGGIGGGAGVGIDVNLNFGGGSRTVNVSSQRDADNLIGVLRELETASLRS